MFVEQSINCLENSSHLCMWCSMKVRKDDKNQKCIIALPMVSIHKYGTDRNNFVLHQHKGRFHTLHICKLYLDATLILSLSYNADSKHKVFSCLSLMDLPDKYGQVCDNSSLYLTVVVILLPLKNFCIVQDFQSLKENEVLHLSNSFYLYFATNRF